MAAGDATKAVLPLPTVVAVVLFVAGAVWWVSQRESSSKDVFNTAVTDIRSIVLTNHFRLVWIEEKLDPETMRKDLGIIGQTREGVHRPQVRELFRQLKTLNSDIPIRVPDVDEVLDEVFDRTRK